MITMVLGLWLLAAGGETSVLVDREEVTQRTGVVLPDAEAGDPARWEDALAGQGWLDARVYRPPGEPGGLRFELGERYHVAGLALEGLEGASGAELEAELRSCLTTEDGGPRPYTHVWRAQVRRRAEDSCGRRGRLAAVDLMSEIDRERRLVTLRLRVVEGPPVHLTAIEFEGDPRTERWVLERHIRLRLGQPYDLERVRDVRRALEDLGWYEEVQDAVAAEGQDGVRLTYRLKPARTATLRVGLGWTSDDDFALGRVALRETNFHLFRLMGELGQALGGSLSRPEWRGGGEGLELAWTEGARLRHLELAWDRPFRLSARLRQFFRAASLARQYDDYRLRRSDMETGIELRRGKHRKAELFYRFGWTQIIDLEHDAPAIARAGSERRFRSALGLRYSIDTWGRGVRATSSRGLRGEASYEYQGGPLGGMDLSLAEARAEHLWLLWGRRTWNGRALALGARGAWVEEHHQGHEVPIADRLFLGGTAGPVGFDFRGISPREAGRAVGGTALVQGRAAFHLGLWRDARFGAALLYDVGLLADRAPGLRADELRSGVGLGFYRGELGDRPQLYLGMPLAREHGDPRREVIVGFQFSF